MHAHHALPKGMVWDSVMPKGVEQTSDSEGGTPPRVVWKSKMPKGVEHLLPIGQEVEDRVCRIQ